MRHAHDLEPSEQTRQSRAGQDKAGQGNARQSRAGQDKARQGGAGQGKAVICFVNKDTTEAATW